MPTARGDRKPSVGSCLGDLSRLLLGGSRPRLAGAFLDTMGAVEASYQMHRDRLFGTYLVVALRLRNSDTLREPSGWNRFPRHPASPRAIEDLGLRRLDSPGFDRSTP